MRGTYIGGFPEPERDIRGGGGAPEALWVLRGKVCARKTGSGEGARETRFGRVYRRKIRQLDLTIVNYCIVNDICAGINAASQEVFSTCNNRSVCCDVTMYKYVGVHATSQEVFSRTRGVTNKRYH